MFKLIGEETNALLGAILSLSGPIIILQLYRLSEVDKFHYCKFGNFREFNFQGTLHMQSFVKIKPSWIGDGTSFTDIGK